MNFTNKKELKNYLDDLANFILKPKDNIFTDEEFNKNLQDYFNTIK